MKKLKFIVIVLIVGCLSVKLLESDVFSFARGKSGLRKNIYNYLMDKNNRIDLYTEAINLNSGSSANTCVYFVAEVLRKNNFEVPKDISNTSQLLPYLKKKGWKKDFDYKKLKPGDLCFTTDEKGNKNGIPTHTYIFMGWTKKNNYKYAYVCDNQAKDYKNKIYHVRNIENIEKANGFAKDAFAFFMK